MFSSFNFVDYVIIISGTLLCLKRVAEMERYHKLRVVVLTTVFIFVVIVSFLYGFTFRNHGFNDCVINFSESEM